MMLPYSYADTREPSPDVDEVENEGSLIDAFGRDVDTFDDDCSAQSLDEYIIALFASIDRHSAESDERATPRAHVRVNAEREQRAIDAQRARFDDAVSRYLSRFVRTGVAREL